MKISYIENALNLTRVTQNAADASVESVYIGDILSLVLARAEENSIWLTVHGHMNILAVAKLKNVGAIIICEETSPEDGVASKADEENICVFTTQKSLYQTAKALAELGL